jgi:hypothetical protein
MLSTSKRLLDEFTEIDESVKRMSVGMATIPVGASGPHITVGPTSIGPGARQTSVTEKVDAAAAMGIATPPSVLAEVTDADVNAMKERMGMAKLRAFDTWIVTTYLKGLDDDVKRAWLMRVYPEYFDRHREVIDASHAARAATEKLMIDGPQSLSELYRIFVMEMETTKGTPEESVYRNPSEDIADANTYFQRGLFRRAWGLWADLNYIATNAKRPMKPAPSQTRFMWARPPSTYLSETVPVIPHAPDQDAANEQYGVTPFRRDPAKPDVAKEPPRVAIPVYTPPKIVEGVVAKP